MKHVNKILVAAVLAGFCTGLSMANWLDNDLSHKDDHLLLVDKKGS